MKYVMFDNGNIIEGDVLDNIIAAAKRGEITERGESALLVPDTRFGERDVSGLREFANGQTLGSGRWAKKLPRLRKSDCIPLLSLVPKHLRGAQTKGCSRTFTDSGTRV